MMKCKAVSVIMVFSTKSCSVGILLWSSYQGATDQPAIDVAKDDVSGGVSGPRQRPNASVSEDCKDKFHQPLKPIDPDYKKAREVQICEQRLVLPTGSQNVVQQLERG